MPVRKKRAQRQQPALAKPNNAARTNNSLYDVFRRYYRCVAHGLPSRTGVPDGDGNPSIVRNFNFINVLRPGSDGVLTFYVMVTPMGVVQQVAGSAITTTKYSPTPGAASGLSASAVSSNEGFFENSLTIEPFSPASALPYATRLRLVSASHSIMFTGSALHNGGTVLVDQFDLKRYMPVTIPTSGNPRPVHQLLSNNMHNSAMLTPFALIGPARRDLQLMHLPLSHDYVETETVVTTAGNTGSPGTAGSAGALPLTPRYYRVSYSGLDSSASVTISSRVCVQEQLGPSNVSWVPLAQPSELTTPGLLDTFLGQVGTQRLFDWGQRGVAYVLSNAARFALRASFGSNLPIEDL